MENFTLKPVGTFYCSQTSPQESPRQGVLAPQSHGLLKLDPSIPEMSLQDLEGMERVWLVYGFHKNPSWRPLVHPPRGGNRKRGVFATRSPYRPNPVGISCVRLGKISKGEVEIFEHDLINETPVFDIKPYLPYSDSFPESKIGWLENLRPLEILYKKLAYKKVIWLEEKLQINLRDIIRNQLEFEPTNHKKKRVTHLGDCWQLSYKTWRVQFLLSENIVEIKNLYSGYSPEELGSKKDIYGDKNLHQFFNKEFKEKAHS